MTPEPKKATTITIAGNFFRSFFQTPAFILSLFAAIFGDIVYSLDTYIVARIVDTLRLFLAGQKDTSDAVYLFYWLVGLGSLSWLFFRIRDFTGARSQAQIAKRVYHDIFHHLHHHSYQYFTDNFAGSLFKRVSRYVRSFEDFSDTIVYRIIPILVHLVVTIVFIAVFSPLAGACVIVYVVIFCTLSFYLTRWQHTLVDQHDRVDSELSGYVTDTLANHSTILSFGQFQREFMHFKHKCNTTYDLLYAAWTRGNIITSLLAVIAFMSYWSITGLALYLALHGEIIFATFLIINTYNGILTDKIWDVGNIFKALGKIIANAREGTEILVMPHQIQDAGIMALEAKKGKIEFKNVLFSYGRQTVFPGLNLTIMPQEKIGIVGVSGSGKSTLTKILMRLYDIQGGAIQIDGQDITHVTQESLHRTVALVPQDPLLFHRTLAENIRYANPDISEKDFQKFCHIAHCDAFIEKLPQGYETLVGERGIKLSGGERQRVAIARALIAQTPIIIFDEATSALDSESEKYIQEAMFDAIEGKTALVIAHRLSTIVHLDRILVFDDGQIIEDGSHHELMKLGGTYAKLWTIQSGEFRE